MKIYTKTGDDGSTALLGGKRVSKAHLRIEAYGTIDELNSYIGLIRDTQQYPLRREQLKEIQDRMFTIGAHLAIVPDAKNVKVPDVDESDLLMLEKAIDDMEALLPELKSFVLPGGHQVVSFSHVARNVCRRAERCIVRLAETEKVDEVIIRYVNRLSDYLFVLSRKIAQEVGAEEVAWKPRK